jgi:hypothetical protein
VGLPLFGRLAEIDDQDPTPHGLGHIVDARDRLHAAGGVDEGKQQRGGVGAHHGDGGGIGGIRRGACDTDGRPRAGQHRRRQHESKGDVWKSAENQHDVQSVRCVDVGCSCHREWLPV